MMTGDAISKVISTLHQASLDKLRSCYTAYSTDWDGQAESRNYESRVQAMQKKTRNVAWATDVKALSSEKLSAAAQKHFTLKSTLDGLVKEADGILAADRAANMARAKEIDEKYNSFAKTLSNEQIAQAREFVRSYYNTPAAILAFCQRATRQEIAKFETRLTQNQTENNQKEQAAELDQKFLALKTPKREQAYFASVDSVVRKIHSAPADVRRFCNVATEGAIRALNDLVQAEQKYLAAEEQIERLAIAKARSMAWCERVWREYTVLSREIEHYRNAQKLMDLYKEANKIYTDLICEPFVQALKESTDFKTVFARDEELKTFDKTNVLYQGIPLFDTKWKKRMELAWRDARAAAASYCKQGKELYKKEKYAEAFKLFTDAVAYGNADAKYMLGEHYYYGYGVAKSIDVAISHYQSAANDGVLQAMSDLGYVYEYLKSSPSDAFYWRKRAVEAGSTVSVVPLAKLYFDGKGTARNYAAAKTLFEKAAGNNAEANAYLGRMYEDGLGVAVNETLALSYYQKATDVDWAKKAYDALYERLEEERRDQEIADNLALAKAGNAESQCFIGECYYYGYRTDRSYDMAKMWFERAAAQGNGRAMKLLGDMYHYGYGVTVDLNKALKYYDDAIRHGEK